MRDILERLIHLWQAGEDAAVATVVATLRSAPRLPGSAMLVSPKGDVIGSVSGGCIDSAVYECCVEALQTGRGGLFEFGVSDETAFAVGLTCGGTIDVFAETISRRTFPQLDRVYEDIHAGVPVAIATIVDHPDTDFIARRLVIRADSAEGTLGEESLDRTVESNARRFLSAAHNSMLEFGADGPCAHNVKVFISSFVPPARLIVFGANDFASALIDQALLLGYHTTICDARPLFATAERYPAAQEVVVDWPHRYLDHEIAAGRVDERTALCVLTHDPKFDIPLLSRALRECPAGYVGAMGSRRTHDQRIASLREIGLGPAELEQLSSPIGLDLGAGTPEETAVSIAAELVVLNRGGSGARLSQTSGRIHPAQPLRFVDTIRCSGQHSRGTSDPYADADSAEANIRRDGHSASTVIAPH